MGVLKYITRAPGLIKTLGYRTIKRLFMTSGRNIGTFDKGLKVALSSKHLAAAGLKIQAKAFYRFTSSIFLDFFWRLRPDRAIGKLFIGTSEVLKSTGGAIDAKLVKFITNTNSKVLAKTAEHAQSFLNFSLKHAPKIQDNILKWGTYIGKKIKADFTIPMLSFVPVIVNMFAGDKSTGIEIPFVNMKISKQKLSTVLKLVLSLLALSFIFLVLSKKAYAGVQQTPNFEKLFVTDCDTLLLEASLLEFAGGILSKAFSPFIKIGNYVGDRYKQFLSGKGDIFCNLGVIMNFLSFIMLITIISVLLYNKFKHNENKKYVVAI